MGLTAEEAKLILDLRVSRLRGQQPNARPANMAVPKDWYAVFNRDRNESWLVADFWPSGRQIHIHAKRKTGKSIVALWIAANIANGVDPFTGYSQPPVVVAYIDLEMSEDDLLERIEAMGFTPETLGNLRYFQEGRPFPPLDTQAGGEALLDLLLYEQAQAVFLDTFARVVQGDENNNDTYRAFYRWTGGPLKNAGIALGRLDHEGHLEGRSRGASAKADDVDIVYQLRESEDGYQFVRKASRINSVGEIFNISRRDDPSLAFSRTGQAWPSGTIEKVEELDELDVPIETTRRAAANALKEAGRTIGNTRVLNAAIQYRKHRILGL